MRLAVALFVAVTPTEVNSQTYDPVFYYYHGDHLGSTNILTDRNGELVKHYEYTAFGKDRPLTQPCSFNVSHRYTGQILDEATGLYYYNARYYDPELGRFIQADSIVPSAGDPQTLNRYSYVRNNPLNYTDPSGHLVWFAPLLIGAVLGGAGAAVQHGNVGIGILTGTIGGLLGGLGSWAGSQIGSAWGWSFGGAVVGGTAAGAVNTTIAGGNVGLGALAGGIGAAIGFGTAQLVGNLPNTWWGDLAQPVLSAIGGGVGGGIGAAVQGGNFLQGFAYGAAGAAIAYGLSFTAAYIKAFGSVSRNLEWYRSRIELEDVTDDPQIQHIVEQYEEMYDAKVTGLRIYRGDLSAAGVTGADGLTVDGNAIILNRGVTDLASPQNVSTVGHELTHVVQFRSIPGFSGRYAFQAALGHMKGNNYYEFQAEKRGNSFARAVTGLFVPRVPGYSVPRWEPPTISGIPPL